MKKKRRIRRKAEPKLGWVYLTRAALDAARERLDSDEQGVRDELGFGAIHFGYADRFFPGTSVLLTRLRYALFIPWLYEDLQREYRGETFPRDELETMEQELALALKRHYVDSTKHGQGLDGLGIIGRFVVDDHPPVVLPSQIYWPTLVTWGIVAEQEDGSRPARTEVQTDWGRFAPSSAQRLKSQDGDVLNEVQPLFDLPKFSESDRRWSKRHSSGKISFELSEAERRALRTKLKELPRPPDPNASDGLSLFAQLAENIKQVDVYAKSPWSSAIRRFADDSDKHALRRAEQAAYLVQIGRGVYDALVARLRVKEQKNFDCKADEYLEGLLDDKALVQKARSLDFAAMAKDGVRIDPDLQNLLRKLQDWCAARRDVADLLDLFRDREINKKGEGKARLARGSRDRRRQWTPPPKGPRALSYRWDVVATLLIDLKYGDKQ